MNEPRTWHDGMTLVTHPDGTRCWHRIEAARSADRPSLREAILNGIDERIRPVEWPNGMADRVIGAIDAALRQALEGEEARQRHVPGAIDIFDLVCSCGWRQSKQADPDEDWWVHVTSEREFAFRPSTGSEEGGPTRVE
jgi:hypothetical protein